MAIELRSHIHQESFNVPPAVLFSHLIAPTSVSGWWGASRVIVIPELNGLWAAAWGADSDDPDYVSAFVIRAFEPPRRLLLDESRYFAKSGKLPFEAKMSTEFLIEPDGAGSVLRVTQAGFPCVPEADDFYAACETGWHNTFAGIRRFLAESQ